LSIPEVKDWAYISDHYVYKVSQVEDIKISNVGRVDPYRTYLRAVSPNFFDVVSPTFGKMKFYYPIGELDHQLSSIQTEQLYSYEGENRMIYPLAYKDEFVMDGKFDDKLLLKIILRNGTYYWRETQPLSYLESSPFVQMSKVMESGLTSFVSFPGIYRLGDEFYNSMKEVALHFMVISYNANITTEIKKKIKSQMLSIFNLRATVETLDDELEFTKDVRVILNYAFSAITVAFSLIAFFSLSNIMYMNIMEQKQEIGILRSLGLNRFSLIKIYIYEGFTILMSAGILGVSIFFFFKFIIFKIYKYFLKKKKKKKFYYFFFFFFFFF